MTEHIDNLLQRFFEGTTSLAEERELQEYFQTAEQLPEQHLPYREMFAWYVSGMPEPAATKPRLLRSWLRPVAAAVILSAITVIAWATVGGADSPTASLYADNYVERDGIKITGMDIEPEINVMVSEIDELNAEIDRKIDEMQYETDF